MNEYINSFVYRELFCFGECSSRDHSKTSKRKMFVRNENMLRYKDALFLIFVVSGFLIALFTRTQKRSKRVCICLYLFTVITFSSPSQMISLCGSGGGGGGGV